MNGVIISAKEEKIMQKSNQVSNNFPEIPA
jgi:hypothetical protein